MTAAARGTREPGGVLLLSCYELGHAPHALAMSLGFLERAGFAPAAQDLARTRLEPAAVARARLVAISLPMHTALRLALPLIERVKEINPDAVLCGFGLYAVLFEVELRARGVAHVLGGEVEAALVTLAERLDAGERAAAPAPPRVLERLDFVAPSRRALPRLEDYARLADEGGALHPAGYVEATRGCLDTCRHCPVPAVYGGRFFVIDRGVVLTDVAAQVAAGAEHITFGDPDFLNGPGHTLGIVRELHRRWPALTFDVTAQVSHLLRAPELLPELVDLGCAFVTSAFESLSDTVLAALGKRHRRAEVERLLDLAAGAGLTVRPTFVTFTPWTTLPDLVELTDLIAARDLVAAVAPIQMAIRLLVPPGSLLLAGETAAAFGAYDPALLGHAWRHPDPRMDALAAELAALVAHHAAAGRDAADTFDEIRAHVHAAAGRTVRAAPARSRARAAGLTEPWFC